MIASISTILPRETVNPMTTYSCPPTVTTTPAAPFTSADRFGAGWLREGLGAGPGNGSWIRASPASG